MHFKLSRFKPVLGGLPLLLLAIAVTALVLWPRTEPQEASVGQWTCSMHPQVRSDKPGKCPICGMDLVPVSQFESLQSRLEERGGLETAPVARRELFKEILTVGMIDYNETRVADITARIDGRVDRLYVDFAGVNVRRNDHLVDVYSPELVVAQGELLRSLDAVERGRRSGAGAADQFFQSNLESARAKLRLWGILPEQIEEFERRRTPLEHVTLYSPIEGTVIEKNVRVGQYVSQGDVLYRIAELDPIWLYLDIYEYDIGWVRYGQRVDVSLEAMTGRTFQGMLTFIDPFLNESTRTIKVRVNLTNPEHWLKPGMYASATIRVRINSDGSPAPTGLEGKFTCPMHPEVITPQAGRCPICQMPLQQVPSQGPFAYVDPAIGRGDHAGHSAAEPADTAPRPLDAASQSTTADRADHSAAEPAQSTQSMERGASQAADHSALQSGPGEHETHGEMQAAAAQGAADDSFPLAIPATAVLDTGRRRIAYRKRADGAYEIVEIAVGPRSMATDGDSSAAYYPVIDGLSEGDEVVVRAGFLLDSQRQIEGMPSLFFPHGAAPATGHAGHAMPAEE